jgi:hypothetical protein
MPNLNQLIYTGADFKLFLSILGGGTYPLLTGDSIALNTAKEEELIYAIGDEDPIGNKQNARKRTGKLSMQLGELNAILEIEGLLDATDIVGATLAVTAIVGGFQRTLKQVNINTEGIDVKRKDKETIVSMDYTALSLV